MNLDKVILGSKVPEEFNVIIEIPQGGYPIKYEIDKESASLVVDRLVATSMQYPANYGFLPQTLGKDGDPLDALVITPSPLYPMSVIKVRPLGVLLMEDESGFDEKIICVPVTKVTAYYDKIQVLQDLPDILLSQIKHFFETYKNLENGKWVKITGFQDKEFAYKVIKDSIINK
jgi:inorganic pyrophosphatase